jgi:hypothetical protein
MSGYFSWNLSEKRKDTTGSPGSYSCLNVKDCNIIVKNQLTYLYITIVNPHHFFGSTVHPSMNVTQHCVILTLLKSTTQEPSISQVIQSHCTIPLETKMDEVEVLRDDRCSRAREVQRKRIFNRTQVMQLKNEVLWKVGLISPDNPPNTYIAQPKLVTTSS